VHVSGVDDGSYDVEYWNTMTGEVLLNQKIETIERLDNTGYILPLAVPPFEGDVAVKFKKNQEPSKRLRSKVNDAPKADPQPEVRP
jgi:predicted xylose isomerase-like sugar epimerase